MRPNCNCYVATKPYADRGFYPHDSKCASVVRPARWAAVAVAMLLTSCATTYRPSPAVGPFSFTPSDEQCAQLLKEKRTYRATEKAATYVSGATALLSVLFLGLVEEKAAPAASAGATLLASGVGVFAGSQVESLEEEIHLGACR